MGSCGVAGRQRPLVRSDLSPEGPEQAFGHGSSLALVCLLGLWGPAQDCGPVHVRLAWGSQNFAVSCEAGAGVSLFTPGDPVAPAQTEPEVISRALCLMGCLSEEADVQGPSELRTGAQTRRFTGGPGAGTHPTPGISTGTGTGAGPLPGLSTSRALTRGLSYPDGVEGQEGSEEVDASPVPRVFAFHQGTGAPKPLMPQEWVPNVECRCRPSGSSDAVPWARPAPQLCPASTAVSIVSRSCTCCSCESRWRLSRTAPALLSLRCAYAFPMPLAWRGRPAERWTSSSVSQKVQFGLIYENRGSMGWKPGQELGCEPHPLPSQEETRCSGGSCRHDRGTFVLRNRLP